MRPAIGLAILVLAAGSLCGCESTVQAALKISRRGSAAFKHSAFAVARVDPRIRVVATTLIRDSSGTAAVVELRNTSRESIADAPIAIDVRDAGGQSVFANDQPGSEYDLYHVPLLAAHGRFRWIDDQVLASGTPARVSARVGFGRMVAGPAPRLQTRDVALAYDQTNGWVVNGEVRNASSVLQEHLVVFATALRGRLVVSAGRAILPRLAPGKTLPFHAYLLGNPRGARIVVSIPPSDI